MHTYRFYEALKLYKLLELPNRKHKFQTSNLHIHIHCNVVANCILTIHGVPKVNLERILILLPFPQGQGARMVHSWVIPRTRVYYFRLSIGACFKLRVTLILKRFEDRHFLHEVKREFAEEQGFVVEQGLLFVEVLRWRRLWLTWISNQLVHLLVWEVLIINYWLLTFMILTNLLNELQILESQE